MVALGMRELGLGHIGFLSSVVGSNEDIGNRQHGSQAQDFVTAAKLGTTDQHLGQLFRDQGG